MEEAEQARALPQISLVQLAFANRSSSHPRPESGRALEAARDACPREREALVLQSHLVPHALSMGPPLSSSYLVHLPGFLWVSVSWVLDTGDVPVLPAALLEDSPTWLTWSPHSFPFATRC